jgi:hypothetical protein
MVKEHGTEATGDKLAQLLSLAEKVRGDQPSMKRTFVVRFEPGCAEVLEAYIAED